MQEPTKLHANAAPPERAGAGSRARAFQAGDRVSWLPHAAGYSFVVPVPAVIVVPGSTSVVIEVGHWAGFGWERTRKTVSPDSLTPRQRAAHELGEA